MGFTKTKLADVMFYEVMLGWLGFGEGDALSHDVSFGGFDLMVDEESVSSAIVQ